MLFNFSSSLYVIQGWFERLRQQRLLGHHLMSSEAQPSYSDLRLQRSQPRWPEYQVTDDLRWSLMTFTGHWWPSEVTNDLYWSLTTFRGHW